MPPKSDGNGQDRTLLRRATQLLQDAGCVIRDGKRRLPILVMTGDSNRDNQAELLQAGANDLVLKPIAERLLVTKVLFQLRLSKLPEPGTRPA